jgi:hypothetical protein
MAPAYWVLAMAVIGIVAVAALRETSRDPLPI